MQGHTNVKLPVVIFIINIGTADKNGRVRSKEAIIWLKRNF
jgi:hypothetical protein